MILEVRLVFKHTTIFEVSQDVEERKAHEVAFTWFSVLHLPNLFRVHSHDIELLK